MMGNTEVYEKLESDINPNERKSNHFSQMTTEEKKYEKKRCMMEKWRKEGENLGQLRLITSRIGKNIMFLQMMALQQCFFIRLQSVVQFSFSSFLNLPSSYRALSLLSSNCKRCSRHPSRWDCNGCY